MPTTQIPDGTEALIVSAAEARSHARSGIIPSGGQRRCTILCFVPVNPDLRSTLRAAIGEAATMPPLQGLTSTSLRERYMVRIERTGRNGKALAPTYKTPLAGTLIPAPPVKAPKAAAPASAQSAPKTTSKASAAQSTTSKRGKGK